MGIVKSAQTKKAALNEMDQSLKDCYPHKQGIKFIIREKEAYFGDLCSNYKEKEGLLSQLKAEAGKKEEFLKGLQQRE